MGMCFGVRDALQVADEVEEPETVTIHGELVHNEVVLDALKQRGFHMADEVDRSALPETESVLITAHGVSERERARLAKRRKALIDTTCPLVRLVHEAAQKLRREERFVIVLGRPGHVEVEGVVGDLDDYAVVYHADDVCEWDLSRLGVICQSTMPPADAELLLALIRERNPRADVRFVDTICYPTRARQEAITEMLGQVEAVVVVGGINSNNTCQLVDRVRSRGLPAFHVQTADDLDSTWFTEFERVGLTAGTSTPGAVIDEVHEQLVAMRSAV